MTDYTEFFLKSPSSVVELETLEISHSSFTKTYRVVRNAVGGITAQLETGVSVTFDYYPMRVSNSGARDDLDQSIKIEFGDLGEVVPTELDEVAAADTFDEKPVVLYRTYRSDDLTAPLYGPITLEITSFAFTREGAAFEAKAPALNINKTGEIYSFDRFPMLRGFL